MNSFVDDKNNKNKVTKKDTKFTAIIIIALIIIGLGSIFVNINRKPEKEELLESEKIESSFQTIELMSDEADKGCNDAKKDETENETKDNTKEDIKDDIEDEVKIINEKITIQDIDWNAYQNIMNEEEYKTLLEYLPVLKGMIAFTWDIDFYFNDEREQKVVTINEFKYILDNEIWDAGYEPDELWVNSIAICDIDEDKTNELILLLDNIAGHFLILHKENEEFYGTNRVYRAFEILQTNGTYIASGGAACNHYYKMKFVDGKFEENQLGHTDKGLYYIGDDEVSDEVFKKWEDNIMSEDAVYYDAVKKDETEKKTENETKNYMEDKITIQDIDWDAYQNIMNAEEYETLLEYLLVLKNEVTFTWDVDDYKREQRVVNIDEFRYILNNELWHAGYEPDELWVNSIAVCDMDEDGIKELILSLDNIQGHFLILHKENEEFYGTNRVLRGFEGLTTNGVYIGSNGATYNDYCKMKFIDGKFEESILGCMRGEDNYDIGDDEVSSDVFWEWVESIRPEYVVYYDAVKKADNE